ncbi:T3SS effector HopA1 family protein [Larkinella bovis]|uniref:T3SS effector HopA1 family protein n=1 Tax=Larkinella bovis TaxID=683041 RepID=A0ABW0IA29_9BACT
MISRTREQIHPLVQLIRISEDRRRIFLDGEDKTDAISREMMAEQFIFDASDVRAVLQVWLYRKHYIRPGQPATPEPNDVPLFTYRDTGVTLNFWNSRGWRYPTGTQRPSRFFSEVVLLKGSQARWVNGGRYMETGIDRASGWILLESNEPTHNFGAVADAVKFNWIYGRHLSDGDNRGYIRFYVNMKPTKAAVACLVREIQNCFNLHEVPFSLKFVADPAKYDRADSAVLYTDHRYLNLVAILLQNVYQELRRNEVLRTDVPLFTRELAPGLSVAEEPDTGTSFGLDRAFQLADALMAVGHDFDPVSRCEKVDDFLLEKGYDPDNFYRNPFSAVQYAFLFAHFAELNRLPRRPALGSGDDGYRVVRFRLIDEIDWFGQLGFSRKAYLLAALRIAIKLCREAIWSFDGQSWSCNWLSYRPGSDRKEVVYRMLDDSFEEGVKGIRFFLKTVFENCYESELLAFVVQHARGTGPMPEHMQRRFHPDWANKDPDLAPVAEALITTGPANPMPYGRSPGDARRLPPASDGAGPDEKIADTLIGRYLTQDRPLGNAYGEPHPERSDLFCPNLLYGLAGFGYYFLHVYDPHRFKPIALSIP